MPIIAGIDEAGYGPTLGPLVVSATAFASHREAEDLWELLSAAVCRKALKSDPRLPVADSKKVYSGGRGLNNLEATVLSFTGLLSGPCAGPLAMLHSCSPEALSREKQCAWYEGETAEAPRWTSPERLSEAAPALKACAESAEVRMVLARSMVVFAPEFNRHVRRLRNKAAVSFAHCVSLLRCILDLCDEDGAEVFVDKQGGRNRYGYLLLRAFPQQKIRILNEGRDESVYRLTGQGKEMTITFAKGAEDKQLPVALASMYSKYVRELYVTRLNAFWQQHVPDLKPTAGYPQDASRFLQDIESARAELGIPLEQFARAR